MRVSDFDFDLPDDLIALRPVRPRRAAKMLVARGTDPSDPVEHATAADLPRWLRPGDLLVMNDTRVIPARLRGVRRRESADGPAEVRIEATLSARVSAGVWRALVRPARRLRPGDVIRFEAESAAETLSARVLARDEGEATLGFDREGPDLDAAIAAVGLAPLPPYIESRRPADAQDAQDYQTVFARRDGSVAAPTAALHFDETLFSALADRGVRIAHVTLHVGPGTFLPIRGDDARAHVMHAEWGEIDAETAGRINATRDAGNRVIAVGTTALRLLESAADGRGRIAPWRGETDIFITPGYRFRAVDGLMTNFHLPKSTLFMLVSALMGTERMRAVYAEAIANGYRFYSYGDASLLLPQG